MTAADLTVAMALAVMPPAAYDYPPQQPYLVRTVAEQKIESICGKHPTNGFVAACAWPELGIIFITEGLDPKVQELILRHERAHLNGWKH